MSEGPLQQTIGAECSLTGVGLHTGASVRVRLEPAAPNTGIVFRRSDQAAGPPIPAALESVVSTDRGTALGSGEACVHTVEHLMAALGALSVDNVMVAVDGPEIPILDGSFRPFFDAIRAAGITEQEEPARELVVPGPVTANAVGGASYVATPAESYRISATIEFDHPLVRRQFGSFGVAGDAFDEEIASARTFGFLREAEELRARGLARGVTLENALILDDDGLVSGSLRFPDEFVRHKIGDVVGDLALLGRRMRGHIVADRPSHAGNIELARRLAAAARQASQTPIVDIQRIMQHLPHRYPMLLVDRIVEFEQGRRIAGIKNVTINEPFFQGHYPGHPIMPGVLIIEAMAQVGGLLLMDAIENLEDKVVYFMTMDNVKWRRPVTPGDQIRFEVEMVQLRRHTCRMRGAGYVDGQIVAEAEFMARIVDR
ncbi:MAG: bifunctional UDP-3-O-[3-hydroxymyristoyl] N-acetylglucosamine deacetylase/3-hydroxyacyl-ACP dehydratase [Gemmatimonadetes bacterium]|nr:bifunctional UDP-3-O-[3-hydroxymyristoyl] N-acetylglucosamine deacetylase/3-hydroxyacyl-ACP dehydratase [Gemmatimonadota bacterium]